MKKQFTAEEMLLKHETNIKSAMTGYFLSGVLGIIYIVRFIITKNFDFYFSLTFNEFLLRWADGKNPDASLYALIPIGVYMVAYVLVALVAAKKNRLSLALGLYIFDCLWFVPLFILRGAILPEMFIDVIVHSFVVIFLVVGVRSEKALRA